MKSSGRPAATVLGRYHHRHVIGLRMDIVPKVAAHASAGKTVEMLKPRSNRRQLLQNSL
jgi:hypothetical protein